MAHKLSDIEYLGGFFYLANYKTEGVMLADAPNTT